MEPIIEFTLFVAIAGIPGEDEQEWIGEENLMDGMIDFLSVKVPGVQLHRDVGCAGMGQFQRADVDVISGGFLGVEGFAPPDF